MILATIHLDMVDYVDYKYRACFISGSLKIRPEPLNTPASEQAY